MIVQLGINPQSVMIRRLKRKAMRKAKQRARQKSRLSRMQQYQALLKKMPAAARFPSAIKKALVRSQKKRRAPGFIPDIPGYMLTMPSAQRKLLKKIRAGKVTAPAFVRNFMEARKRVTRPRDVLRKRKTPYKRFRKLDGDRGVIQTVKIIRALANQFKKDIRLRELAGDIVRPYRKNVDKIEAVFDWIKANVKYVRDIEGIETIHTPYKILRQGYGDCDDLATISATLLKAVGYKVFYVVTSNRPDKKFNHIFLIVTDGRQKYIFDPTIKIFNKARRGITRKKILY